MKILKKIGFGLSFCLALTCPLLLSACSDPKDDNPEDPYANFTVVGSTITAYTGTDEEVIIPNGITTIADDVFVNNDIIEEIIISDSVTSIGWEAFRWCDNLESVHIGAGLNINDFITEPSLGEDGLISGRMPAVFGCCYNLEEITVSKDNPSLKSSGTKKSLLSKDGKTLVVGTKYLEIPTGVETIGQSAFFGYYNGLKEKRSITIPNSVKNIGNYAFYHNVSGLTDDGGLNFNENKAIDLVLPASIETIGEGAFRGMNIKSVDFNSVVDISNYAFGECKNLKNIELLEGVKNIGGKAFEGCSLEFENNELIIPSTVTNIGNYAFYKGFNEKYNNLDGENSVLTINLPNGLKSIGRYAFASSNKTEINQINLPKTIEQVGNYVFAGSIVNNLIFNGDVSDWAGINFEGLKANPIYLLKINDAVKSIKFTNSSTGEYEFNHTSDVILSEGVNKIGSYAFPHMTISNFNLPSTVIEIGTHAFDGTSYTVTQLVLPKDLTIKTYAFSYSNFNLIVPKDLTKIEERAFNGVSNTINLVNSETEIENKVLNGDWDENWNAKSISDSGVVTSINVEYDFDIEWLNILKANPQFTFNGYTLTGFDKSVVTSTSAIDIIIPEGTKAIKSYVFMGCGMINRLVIPASVTSIGSSAFGQGSPNATRILNIEFNGTANQWSQIQFDNSYANPMIVQYLAKGDKSFKFSDYDSTKTDTLKIQGVTGSDEFAINTYAFTYFSLFDKIEVGENIDRIKKDAFARAVADVYISSQLDIIDALAFSYLDGTIYVNGSSAGLNWDKNWNAQAVNTETGEATAYIKVEYVTE